MRALLLIGMLLALSACALEDVWADRAHEQCGESTRPGDISNCHDRVDRQARENER